jgi:hypothetical protein
MIDPALLEIDPETGFSKLWTEVAIERYPVLVSAEAKFRVAIMCFDGTVYSWISHIEGKSAYGAPGEETTVGELSKVPLHTRSETIRLVGKLGDWGYIPRVFAEDDVPTGLIASTIARGGPKSSTEQCELISKYSVEMFGKQMSADEVWNGLPKELMLMALGQLYGLARKLQQAENLTVDSPEEKGTL